MLDRQAAAAQPLTQHTTHQLDARELLDFIAFERACCPFYSFGLRFPSPHDAIWLDVRSERAEVKEMLRAGVFALAANAR